MVKITCVDHIETSSICDNKCPYCPAPIQHKHRAVGFMSMITFENTMKWVDYCVRKGTQTQLNLYGIGEPTLNPLLIQMIRIARDHLPPSIPLHLNTNGNHITDHLVEEMKAAGITSVDVTGHKVKEATHAIRILKKHRIFGCLSMDFMLNPNNWAGQVKWFEPDYTYDCPWLYYGRVFIMWDGRVTRCSLDAFAKGILGTVNDDPDKIEPTKFELCKHCHSIPPGGR